MNTRHRWIIVIGALLLAAAVGAIAYNAGISEGIEQSGKVIAAPPGAVPYYYVGHRPWGGFFFVPLFFIALWLLAFRGFRHHHHHACHYEHRDAHVKDA